MKTCVFMELLVVSFEEQAARRIRFSDRVTLVIGGNDTGKSSLLKSLYATFGAEPAVVHPGWREVNPLSVVRFRIDQTEFAMLRQGRQFALYGADGALIWHGTRTSDLAPVLAELFDFGLILPDREGRAVIPPPAFLFLPFYVDQDASWQRNWSGFTGLGQFKDWRRSVVEYHAGIRPNEYYRLRAEGDVVKRELEEKRGAERALRAARERVEEHLPRNTFTVDVAAFQAEVETLLAECDVLSQAEERYKLEIADLRSTKFLLEQQVAITRGALKEIKADYRFATHQLSESVDCPTCGGHYDNHFADRFQLAMDQDRCRDLLVQLQTDLATVSDGIHTTTSALHETRGSLSRINDLLGSRRETIRLGDLIASEGRKEVRQVFWEGLRDYAFEIKGLDDRAKGIKARLRELTDESRKEEILSTYRRLMADFLEEVSVRTMKPSHYADIAGKISETGSDQPRALLAYYYAVLHTMRQFSSTTFFPLVLDSPNQQALDNISLPLVLDFILRRRPSESQLIMALEERPNIEHPGVEVELVDKLQVLSRSEYDRAREEVRPLLDSLIMAGE